MRLVEVRQPSLQLETNPNLVCECPQFGADQNLSEEDAFWAVHDPTETWAAQTFATQKDYSFLAKA